MARFHIPLRYQLFALVAVAFVFGLIRWRSSAVDAAVERLKERQRAERDRALQVNREVRNEVEVLDDVGLADRASRWLRNHDG